jgi:hypothetical protein
MTRRLNRRSKLLAAVAMSAVVGTGVVVGTGTSQASTVYRFRLSQFAHLIANVCVQTDADRVCSGNWAIGKSEVFDVRADSLYGWQCWSEIVGGPTVSTTRFSREVVKECYLQGDLTNYSMDTK